MRTVAGLLNILLGVALAFPVATVVLVASVVAFLANRRAHSSAGS